MKLTKSVDFALRILIHLAAEEKLSTMPRLSESLAISYNNLTKLVQALSKAGLVQTRQGKHGGILLGKNPHEVSLKMVIDLIEGPLKLSECMGGSKDSCQLSTQCRIRGVFQNVQRDIDDILAKVSVADIMASEVHPPQELKTMKGHNRVKMKGVLVS